MRERTLEFQQIFDSNRRRDAKIQQGPPTSFTVARNQRPDHPQESARFNEYAKVFASELARTSENIGHLTRILKQRTVYDDRGEEIGSLTGAIKGQLQQLQHDMDTLAELKVEAQPAAAWFAQEKLESSEHSDTIVNTLRSRLVRTGQDFTSVLKQRTQLLTKDANRRSNLVAAGGSSAESAMFSAGGLDQALEHRLTTSNSTYYQSRYDAVRDIEAAVNEVGEIFHDFTAMVEEQNEAIIRIDQDVDMALTNVNAGTNELMKYLASLSNNRGLIIKIFAVLFAFLLFFGFVVVR